MGVGYLVTKKNRKCVYVYLYVWVGTCMCMLNILGTAFAKIQNIVQANWEISIIKGIE